MHAWLILLIPEDFVHSSDVMYVCMYECISKDKRSRRYSLTCLRTKRNASKRRIQQGYGKFKNSEASCQP